MINLDNQKLFSVGPLATVVQSFALFDKQLLAGWRDNQAVALPEACRQAKNLVFCGMGGSNLAPELVRSVWSQEIKQPIILVRGYQLPKFVSRESLVIICSYSGNTEEALSCLAEAKKRRAPIVAIASGGQLAKRAVQGQIPLLKLDAKYNPSGQPRYGLGLQLGAILALLSRLNFIKPNNAITDVAASWRRLERLWGPSTGTSDNTAKATARALAGRLPLIFSAEFLSANGHILANQINESAKNLAVPFELPELNHHLLEGLALPSAVKRKLIVVFLSSPLFGERNLRRIIVTQRVLAQQRIKFIDFQAQAKDKFSAAVEVLAWGSYVGLYLTALNRQNPDAIHWVDFFKAELRS